MNLKDIPVSERKRIAALAGTADSHLRQLQTGARKASAALAIKIEQAAVAVGVDVRREGLCAACSGCDLARVARKVRK